MTRHDEINNLYFEWLVSLIERDGSTPFRKLLTHLHTRTFEYMLPMDGNRAEDGVSLRYKFSIRSENVEDAELYLYEPCSVLEMMIALTLHCEEIMSDTRYGDRTVQWFWKMVTSLGLNGMRDDVYDKRYVDDVIDRFLNREYESNGKGGLFTIKNCKKDLRRAEIWHQMSWFINTVV